MSGGKPIVTQTGESGYLIRDDLKDQVDDDVKVEELTYQNDDSHKV